MARNAFWILVLAVVSTSCVSKKKMVYFQQKEVAKVLDSVQNYEPRIQPSDLLYINVSTVDIEAAAPFNLYESVGTGMPKPINYLVNKEGEINFPVLGKINVSGLTTDEIATKLTGLLAPYLKNPVVNVSLKNFKITVLGEVKNPGSYPVVGERISVLDAIGLAGDLTIQGQRSNITLLREQHGKKKYITLDLTDKNIALSPYFYLAQNDVIYVEPNKTKMNSAAVGPNTSIIISAISTLISLLAILKIIK